MRRSGSLVILLSTLVAATGCPTSKDGSPGYDTDSGLDADTADPGGDGGDNVDSGEGADSGLDDSGDVPSVEMVDATVSGSVLLANNYPNQLYTLFRSSFTAGSGMGRLRLMARWCEDAACEQPIALSEATVDGADDEGWYVYSTASTSGEGFDKEFIFHEAPLGTSYLQLIGDSETSANWGLGTCSDLSDCPGDADVLQTDQLTIDANNDGGSHYNPPAATIEVTVDAAGEEVALGDVLLLGSLVFDGEPLWTPAPSDPGSLLVAMSNEADDFRNFMALIDLDDATGNDGAVSADSYTLQKDGAEFYGDVCGVIEGGDALWAVGIDGDGANIFSLGADGQQLDDDPVVTIPPLDYSNALSWPWPCRGVYLEKSGDEHLYLLQFDGAGSLDTSFPHTLYHVNITESSYSTPMDDYTDMAFKGLVVKRDGTELVALDMSWSRDSQNEDVYANRLVPISLRADGVPGAVGTPVVTSYASDDPCDSTVNWPTELASVQMDGAQMLLMGHDTGVTVYDNSLVEQYDIDLSGFGRLFSQFAISPDGARANAVPGCKALTANSDFELPYGSGVEASDKNLVAELDISGGEIVVASTDIDVNGDGTADDGIDMDYWFLKDYIRSFESTLSIPPVVYTGPRAAVGESMLFVRGSGIQGNGGDTISSSGLGQVQDVGFFDLATGHGAIFGEYMPWFDGLSSDAGRGSGIWGYDVNVGQESSVGAVHYIPAP